MNRSNNHQDEGTIQKNGYEATNFISIQDYSGSGYCLYDSNDKVFEIAKDHEEDIMVTIIQFFLDTYDIHVNVHNMVSGNDAVTVFVESLNEPYFHTFVIVPVDETQKKVKLDHKWSYEGEIERAIKSGLYVMACGEGFDILDNYLDRITKKYPVVGTPNRVIDNIKATGYTTSYYFISPFGKVFKNLFEEYMHYSNMNKRDVRHFFDENGFEAGNVTIRIEFYMKDIDASPDEKIVDNIMCDIEHMTGIPKGIYSICLNDNLIDKKRGIGKKGNTLESSLLMKQ